MGDAGAEELFWGVGLDKIDTITPEDEAAADLVAERFFRRVEAAGEDLACLRGLCWAGGGNTGRPGQQAIVYYTRVRTQCA